VTKLVQLAEQEKEASGAIERDVIQGGASLASC
jgi:hypothetical protein